MTSVFSPFIEMMPEEFRRVTEVTYLSYVYGTMAALRRMRPRNRGMIVQVGSALAYRSIPLQSAYCGAKHAIRGFTDSLRCELIHDGSEIHLALVQMPALNTPQFNWVKSRLPRKPQPVPPIFEPEVGARAIYYAAHTRRREVYVVGNKIIPGWLDHYLASRGWDGQRSGARFPGTSARTVILTPARRAFHSNSGRTCTGDRWRPRSPDWLSPWAPWPPESGNLRRFSTFSPIVWTAARKARAARGGSC